MNKVEIIVNGVKEDEFELSDGSLDFLFEEICNMIAYDIEEGE